MNNTSAKSQAAASGKISHFPVSGGRWPPVFSLPPLPLHIPRFQNLPYFPRVEMYISCQYLGKSADSSTWPPDINTAGHLCRHHKWNQQKVIDAYAALLSENLSTGVILQQNECSGKVRFWERIRALFVPIRCIPYTPGATFYCVISNPQQCCSELGGFLFRVWWPPPPDIGRALDRPWEYDQDGGASVRCHRRISARSTPFPGRFHCWGFCFVVRSVISWEPSPQSVLLHDIVENPI